MDKHSFHVVLPNGVERDIKADDAKLTEGNVLIFFNDKDKLKVAYNCNEWKYVETEAMDDRG